MVDAVLSLSVETFLMMPLAVGYVAYLTVTGASHFSPTVDPGLAAAFVATGVMAAVPLVAFTIGAMRLSLSVLGFIQYLAPILIVALGVFVFGERSEPERSFRFPSFGLASRSFWLARFANIKTLHNCMRVLKVRKWLDAP